MMMPMGSIVYYEDGPQSQATAGLGFSGSRDGVFEVVALRAEIFRFIVLMMTQIAG